MIMIYDLLEPVLKKTYFHICPLVANKAAILYPACS